MEDFKNEDQLQHACFKDVWNQYPVLRRHLWAIPNGALRDIRLAQKLKATGLLSGVWDVHMFWRGQFYIFEFKFGNNDLTRDHVTKSSSKVYGQYEWGQLMVAHGAIAHVIRHYDQFIGIIAEILLKNP